MAIPLLFPTYNLTSSPLLSKSFVKENDTSSTIAVALDLPFFIEESAALLMLELKVIKSSSADYLPFPKKIVPSEKKSESFLDPEFTN